MIIVDGGIIFLGMGSTQKLNMACIRGHVYVMKCNAVCQIWTIDNTHSVIKESDPQNAGFTMLVQVMTMSKTVQIQETTTVSILCVTHVIIGVRDGGGRGGSCPPIRAVWRHAFGQRVDIIRAKPNKCLKNTNLGSVTEFNGKKHEFRVCYWI